MTSRGLNEYMSTVNAFGSNSQAAQNYAQNYRRKGEDALNTKMADWRAAGQAKAATILQAAQEKYEGQIAQGKEVVEAATAICGSQACAEQADKEVQVMLGEELADAEYIDGVMCRHLCMAEPAGKRG